MGPNPTTGAAAQMHVGCQVKRVLDLGLMTGAQARQQLTLRIIWNNENAETVQNKKWDRCAAGGLDQIFVG